MYKVPLTIYELGQNPNYSLQTSKEGFLIYDDENCISVDRKKYVFSMKVVGASFNNDVMNAILSHNDFCDSDVLLEPELEAILENVYVAQELTEQSRVKKIDKTTANMVLRYAIKTQQILSLELYKKHYPHFYKHRATAPEWMSDAEKLEFKKHTDESFWIGVSNWRQHLDRTGVDLKKTYKEFYIKKLQTVQDEIDAEIASYFAETIKPEDLPRNPDKQREEETVKVVVKAVDFSEGSAESKRMMSEYKGFASASLKFHYPKSLTEVRERVLKRYPYAQPVIDKLLSRSFRLASFGKNRLQIPPTLLWGSPGSGKSSFLRYLMKELGSYTTTVNIGGEGDDHWLGVSKGYATGTPSSVLRALKDSGTINPTFIVDELDKQPPKKENNNSQDKLLKLLEPYEAESWRETYTGMYLNVSHVNWVCTANDLDTIGSPLKSRLQVVKMPLPEKEHIPILMANLRTEIANDDGMDVRWYPDFNSLEVEAIQNSWNDHHNLRILKRQVEQVLSDKFMNLESCVN